MNKRLKILFQIAFGVYVVAVLMLCFGHFDNTPSLPTTFLGIPTDKVAHFCMFLPFPILAFLAFDKYTETPKSTLLFSSLTFVAGVLLALGTEWGQAHLTNYRSGEPWDLAADLLALLLGTLVIIYWDIRKQRKKA
ncbi:MAG: VanZ family protein [Bacteroidales bacterium]|nr:VanZ family protein [Bacteroidales bacterium]